MSGNPAATTIQRVLIRGTLLGCRRAMEDLALRGGLRVCARWRLRGRLGGDHGTLWVADDLENRTEVALEFVGPPCGHDAGARRRFAREVRSNAKVRSAHVLPILAHGETDAGRLFVVTELLQGTDLRRLLDRQRTLGLIETGRILDQICDGLSKIHAVGLVYGGLKASNVFLVSSGAGGSGAAAAERARVTLLRFGLAGAREAAPHASPEARLPDARVDARSDLWSLGALAYRMLAGDWPCDGERSREARVAAARPPSIGRARRGLPAELDGWFERTLAVDPAHRFRSVAEARERFARVVRVYTSGMLAEVACGPSYGVTQEPAPDRVRELGAQPSTADSAPVRFRYGGPAARDSRIVVLPPERRAKSRARVRLAAARAALLLLTALVPLEPSNGATRPSAHRARAVERLSGGPASRGGVEGPSAASLARRATEEGWLSFRGAQGSERGRGRVEIREESLFQGTSALALRNSSASELAAVAGHSEGSDVRASTGPAASRVGALASGRAVPGARVSSRSTPAPTASEHPVPRPASARQPARSAGVASGARPDRELTAAGRGLAPPHASGSSDLPRPNFVYRGF